MPKAANNSDPALQKLSSQKYAFFTAHISALTMSETMAAIEASMETGARVEHALLDATVLISTREDAELRRDTEAADIVSFDGVGPLWAARWLGHEAPERVAGSDLMYRILALCEEKDWRPYVLGATQEILDRALQQIHVMHPNLKLAGSRNGYFTQEQELDIINAINDSGADCLLIGITSPLKARLMNRQRENLTAPYILGWGGQLDILAGNISRAPKWMQKCGLEWSWRVIQEPRRLFGRYVKTNLTFAGWVLKAKLFGKMPTAHDPRES